MLEKIGLPSKPSLRGNNWVVDASHCQGCSSQFTFINRKHHCRRCGGIFCSSCTQQRMVLRGQGDSPVRICEPCKRLEEAARFEMRHGHKNRSSKGSSRLASKNEDEVLNQLLGKERTSDVLSHDQQSASTASGSNVLDFSGKDEAGDGSSNQTEQPAEMGSITPEELRQQAMEEKQNHRTLKAAGKPEEALRAFKRGKELERQAAAMEISLRKNRKRALSSSNVTENQQDTDDGKASGRKNKLSPHLTEEKDDLASELRELGWSDMDLHAADRRPATMSLEGELSALLGEVSGKTNPGKKIHGTDKSLVIAHKKKALQLKREGKLAEAKEELKKAKILEKQIEEQELLGDDEESDDELSSLMRGLDADKFDDLSTGSKPDSSYNFDNLLGIDDDIGTDGKFEVTNDDMYDPEIAAALKSMGWTEDAAESELSEKQSQPVDREVLRSDIQSLKKEALSQKRGGNTKEAMELLKRAKTLESKFGEQLNNSEEDAGKHIERKDKEHKVAPKSKSVIQRELLGIKKKALALRREGRLDEAEEELEKGKILEKQLEDIDNPPKFVQPMAGNNKLDESIADIDAGDEEAEVTDQDLHDPTYLSLLNNLGWQDDEKPNVPSASFQGKNNVSHLSESPTKEATSNIQAQASKKSKGEIQRELLGLKRKALTLRRQGETEEAEEVMNAAKMLEEQLAENNLGWQDDEKANVPSASFQGKNNVSHFNESPTKEAMSNIQAQASKKSKGEIQRELLGLKRKALTLRRQGETEEAEEVMNAAKMLEEQLAEIEESMSNRVPTESNEQKERKTIDSPLENPQFLPSDSRKAPIENMESKVTRTPEKPEEVAQSDEKSCISESKNAQEANSQLDQNSLRQDILAHKRKAVALKREGKVAEAKEELRQAKLLGKRLEEEKTLGTSSSTVSADPNISHVGEKEVSPNKVPNISQVGQKEVSPSSGPKPLSGRERFKLQQESLSHKRQALKLRREGKTEEADAEFELAKAIEGQLEEASSQDAMKSSDPTAESAEDVSVADFLDPQLFSALKAIGIADTAIVSHGPERLETKKTITGNTDKTGTIASQILERPEPKLSETRVSEESSNERKLLEEQVKAEKLKALNLKRSGKQAEALDALRRAKMFEKKLSALAS
ncbi:caldesmon [Capsicum galapagoense]